MKIKINKSCSYEALNDSIIILQADTGKYLEIDLYGKRIFELILNNDYSENELIEKLESIYKSSFNQDELLDFLNKLYEYQIISYV